MVNVFGTGGNHCQIFYYNGFVVAIGNISVLVVSKHTDLGHTNHVAIGCRSREEGVENLVYFLGGKYQCVGFVVETACRLSVVVTTD